MGSLGPWELIIIGVVVFLLFYGPERISKLGGELGKGIKAFKDGVSGEDNKEATRKKTTVKKK